MLRRTTVVVLAAVLASCASQAVADTVSVDDRSDPVGLHDITRVVVDNTGDRIGARVQHRGHRWTGRVRLAFDVSGGPAAEFLADLGHSHRVPARFTRAGGLPWPCAIRTAHSRPRETSTVFSADRRCLTMAPRLRIRAVATSPGRRADTAVSPVVLQQTRPNIVLIMTDDMRADDLRYMPWTRRLIANRGVQFRNGFSPLPMCCPARASLLTGQYSHNHDVYDVRAPWAFSSFDDSSTLATWLRGSGYATAFIGKYLNGYGALPEPGAETGKSAYYVPPGWSDWRASISGGALPDSHPMDGGTYRYFDTTLSRDGRGFTSYSGLYQTRAYGDLTEQVIRSRAASDRPFFLWASYAAPHAGTPPERDDPRGVVRDDGVSIPFFTPARPHDVRGMFDGVIRSAPGAFWDDPDPSDLPAYLQELPPINDQEREAMLELTRQRAEALHVVDQQVKRTIDALAASGELEETLVAFTSDNGFFLGEQRMRQGKILPHEPSLRVPVLLRGPGIPAGEERYDPFTMVDFAPTFARFAGMSPPASVDGVSMLGVARRGDRGWARGVLVSTGPQPIIRTAGRGTYSYARHGGDYSERELRWAVGVRTDRYLYLDLASGEEELYDLATDPHQYDNLAGDPGHHDLRNRLRIELARLASCAGLDCRTPMMDELTAAPGESVRAPG